jgi:DNA-binding NtrC family response regulator
MNRDTILIVEDDPIQRKLIRESLEGEEFLVLEAATPHEAFEAALAGNVDVAIVDYRLGGESGISVIRALLDRDPFIITIMVTAFGNIEKAVEALKAGAYDYIVKPIDFERLLHVIRRSLENLKLKREVAHLRETLSERYSGKDFIFASPVMEEVARLIAKAGKSEATVLISGETGTGKDLAAKAIHDASKRRERPFLTVNVPALPPTLIESELFGAEKGSYTGAGERRIGKFEAAAGGTVFLDEIGELPIEIQSKFLRFLQDREFFRLGSVHPLRSDVRIIAATNRDLETMIGKGEFRSDLFFRLNVIRIHIPPLRERREEIPALSEHFIKKYGPREKKPIEGISREAMAAILSYPFPGNVRELENVIESAVALAEGSTIRLSDLPVVLREVREDDPDPGGLSLTQKTRRLEAREIRTALRETGGIKSRAAKKLGITERILSYKMKILGIPSS